MNAIILPAAFFGASLLAHTLGNLAKSRRPASWPDGKRQQAAALQNEVNV